MAIQGKGIPGLTIPELADTPKMESISGPLISIDDWAVAIGDLDLLARLSAAGATSWDSGNFNPNNISPANGLTKAYFVSASTKMEITDYQGASLSPDNVYKLFAKTYGTGDTVWGTAYLAMSNSSDTSLQLQQEVYVSTEGNTPKFEIINGKPHITLWAHTAKYTVRVTIERLA